jgi:hypothetical protein
VDAEALCSYRKAVSIGWPRGIVDAFVKIKDLIIKRDRFEVWSFKGGSLTHLLRVDPRFSQHTIDIPGTDLRGCGHQLALQSAGFPCAPPDVRCAANRLTLHVLDLVGDPGGLTLSVITDPFFGEGVH